MLDEVRPTATRLLYGPLAAADVSRSFANILTPAPDLNPVEPWADLVLGDVPVLVKMNGSSLQVSYVVRLGSTTDWVGFHLLEAGDFALALGVKANGRVEGSVAVARIVEINLEGDEGWSGRVRFEIARIHKLEPAES